MLEDTKECLRPESAFILMIHILAKNWRQVDPKKVDIMCSGKSERKCEHLMNKTTNKP